MTHEEAISMIRNDMKLHHDYLSGTYRNALNIAIEALEKQIPKKPLDIQKDELYTAEYACPNCNVWITGIDKENIQWGHKQDYCECCGQAIDWSDTK